MRNGKRPTCFGVHFSDQGVADERPYQEAASKALGLDLHLITMDGSSFPDDLMRLLYYQDEPVIGAAMFPMDRVSKLAASQVKVCLGGQGADEIFGGYARYALARPGRVVKSWFSGRRTAAGSDNVTVSGNVGKQLADPRVLWRLFKNRTVCSIGSQPTSRISPRCRKIRGHRSLLLRSFTAASAAGRSFTSMSLLLRQPTRRTRSCTGMCGPILPAYFIKTIA